MRLFIGVGLLAIAACGPRYTAPFVGEWTVSSGSAADTCPPPSLSGKVTHRPGDTTLSITETDDETLGIVMSFHSPSDPATPACDFTAIARSELTAQFQAKACTVVMGARFDILDGLLKLSGSGALQVEFQANVGEKVICQRSEISTYVPR